MIQQSAILSDTEITDIVDPIQKKIPQDDISFHSDLSIINGPSGSRN